MCDQTGNELVPDNSKIILLEPSMAQKIVELFPIARFSKSIMTALGEDSDTRATNNIMCIFQLREMIAVYSLIKSKVAGLNLVFPFFFKQSDDGKERSILWVCDHDPYDLCDMIVLQIKIIDKIDC